MSKEENKLKLLGLISSLSVRDTPNYTELAKELGESRATVMAWASKIQKEQDAGKILDLIDIERIMIDKVADEVKQVLQIHPATGEVMVVDAESSQAQALEEKLEKFKDSVDGLKLLNSDLQSTASLILERIGMTLMESSTIHPKDLSSLANALTSIQVAFFNKPTTIVQVGVGVSEGLSKFRAELKN